MKLSKDMPKSGQFVQVWEYEGKVWSTTLRWVEGVLFSYTEGECTFDVAPGFDGEDDALDYSYIVGL